MRALNSRPPIANGKALFMWLEPSPVMVSEELRAALGGHPLVAEILARRGLTTPQAALAFLDPERYTPSPPDALPDLAIAAQRLRDAITRGERIAVWGDFDVDGQTATTLLVSALRDLGADVVYYIPNRLTESHGIRIEGLARVLAQGVKVLLTCDTGIAEHEAITFAKQRGVSVLVTDHHDLPDELPQADALVNPMRLPPGHPLRQLPGVGVAFSLRNNSASPCYCGGTEGGPYLDLVALGIVADVAEQTGDTRYLLQRGLERLRRPQRIGLRAIFETARMDPTRLSAEHIGFGLGPRLNALGRLGDANLAVELFTTDDWGRARILAAQLEGLNNQRRLDQRADLRGGAGANRARSIAFGHERPGVWTIRTGMAASSARWPGDWPNNTRGPPSSSSRRRVKQPAGRFALSPAATLTPHCATRA